MSVERKGARELEFISSHEKINHLIKNHLNGRSLFLQTQDPALEVKLLSFNENNVITIDTTPTRLEQDQEVRLFRILGRYVELHGMVVRHIAPGCQYNIHVRAAGIAKKDRQFARFSVSENEVTMTNVRASKHTIDATLYNIPTTVKVNFSTYEHKMKASADFVKIDVYGARGTLFDEVRRSTRTVFVQDTQNPECYKPSSPFYFDYYSWLGEKLPKQMEEYKRNKIVSELIVPVTYITHDQTSIPLGYIQMQSRKQPFGEDKVLELQQLAFEMVDRIRDSNTVLIQEKQKIINYSMGGIKALITHADLRDYISRQAGFTFDLLWKMQAPITLYGLIRSAVTLPDGSLMLGVQISGNSSRDGEMKRFQDNVIATEKRMRELTAKKTRVFGQKPG